jgi:hypothetical protein
VESPHGGTAQQGLPGHKAYFFILFFWMGPQSICITADAFMGGTIYISKLCMPEKTLVEAVEAIVVVEHL